MPLLRSIFFLRPAARPVKSVNVMPGLFHPPTRFYAVSSYGGGEGDPKGETPQEQGTNPATSDLEHPGPPPVKEGQGSGGGPTKGQEDGHGGGGKAQSGGSGADSGKGTGSTKTSSHGGSPALQDHQPPENESESVKKHNEDFDKRHDRSASRQENEEKVDKKFWKGHAGEGGEKK